MKNRNSTVLLGTYCIQWFMEWAREKERGEEKQTNKTSNYTNNIDLYCVYAEDYVFKWHQYGKRFSMKMTCSSCAADMTRPV